MKAQVFLGYCHMNRKLEKLAVERIGELVQDVKTLLLNNHQNMGEYCRRDSACGLINSKLSEIDDWVEALK